MQPTDIRRAGVVFSGGPAPAANAVITAVASAFRRSGRDIVGFLHGYSGLVEFDAERRPLMPEQDYHVFRDQDLRGLRNSRGIFIGTSRANPGKPIRAPEDLLDPERTAKLEAVYRGLLDLEIDALVSIGGDDTLKTANLLYEYQRRLPEGQKRIRLVHVPKTIDNDYRGIDFTFGFFTAVDVMGQELQNLRADALSTKSYFIVETMGRKAGWLAYGVAIAGEAHLVVGVEDVVDDLAVEENGQTRLSLDGLVERIVDLIAARARRGKHYGTVVLAEGLAELLPQSYIDGLPRDEHGHISLGLMDIGKLVAKRVSDRCRERMGVEKKVTGVQLGYESRCPPPHAFDVILGSQLGLGAFHALVDKGLDGHMVSVKGQLELEYVPFSELVDPKTLVTQVRYIERGSDFHRLAHELETRVPRR